MIFALGACIAGLLALLCLPAISRRALRMAQAAVERQMPISVDEIVAQRDLLRAEFATERRRLEQAVERAGEVHARDMIEAGRRTSEVARLGSELARTTAAHDAAVAARDIAERFANETGAESGALQKALYDVEGMEKTLRDRLAALSRAHADLERADAQKARAIAALEGERDALSEAHDALDRALMQARLDLSILGARAEALAAQVDMHAEEGRAASATEADLRRKIDGYERQTAADAQAGDAGTKELAMLRRTIVEIGHEVVRLAEREAAEPQRTAARR